MSGQTSASANQALKILLEKDRIMLNDDGFYTVLDPIVADCLDG